MRNERISTGLAVTLGVLTAVLTVVGLLRSPAVLFLAATFGAATFLIYYHASGRMAARVYRRVEERADPGDGRRRRRARRGRRSEGRADGGFGAGPRAEWTGPREGRTAREAAGGPRGRGGAGSARQRARAERGGATGEGGRRTRGPRRRDGPSEAEARRRLGVAADADQAAIKAAYRERVKEVHPDAGDGDEQAFKEVTAAYEALTD